MTVGEKIIRLRKNQKMTQQDLADKLFVSRQSVQKWESDISLPESSKLSDLSKILGITIDQLLDKSYNLDVNTNTHNTNIVDNKCYSDKNNNYLLAILFFSIQFIYSLILNILGSGFIGGLAYTLGQAIVPVVSIILLWKNKIAKRGCVIFIVLLGVLSFGQAYSQVLYIVDNFFVQFLISLALSAMSCVFYTLGLLNLLKYKNPSRKQANKKDFKNNDCVENGTKSMSTKDDKEGFDAKQNKIGKTLIILSICLSLIVCIATIIVFCIEYNSYYLNLFADSPLFYFRLSLLSIVGLMPIALCFLIPQKYKYLAFSIGNAILLIFFIIDFNFEYDDIIQWSLIVFAILYNLSCVLLFVGKSKTSFEFTNKWKNILSGSSIVYTIISVITAIIMSCTSTARNYNEFLRFVSSISADYEVVDAVRICDKFEGDYKEIDSIKKELIEIGSFTQVFDIVYNQSNDITKREIINLHYKKDSFKYINADAILNDQLWARAYYNAEFTCGDYYLKIYDKYNYSTYINTNLEFISGNSGDMEYSVDWERSHDGSRIYCDAYSNTPEIKIIDCFIADYKLNLKIYSYSHGEEIVFTYDPF